MLLLLLLLGKTDVESNSSSLGNRHGGREIEEEMARRGEKEERQMM